MIFFLESQPKHREKYIVKGRKRINHDKIIGDGDGGREKSCVRRT